MAGTSANLSSTDPWRALQDLISRRQYDTCALLFREGESCGGIYLVETGQVRLLFRMRPKRDRVFEIAGPGAVLGLTEAMSGMPHQLTAEAAENVEVAYIERMALMKFLRKRPDVCMQVVYMLSEDLHGLYQRFRTITTGKRTPQTKL